MKKWLKLSIIFAFIVIIAFFVICAVGIHLIIKNNQVFLDVNKLSNYTNKIAIYDASNNILTSNNQNGTPTISINQIPKHTKDAFVAIEDKTFYSHHGLNYGRMVKAMIKNLFSGYAKEGASTITQQLIKNTHLSNEKTLTRKIKEAVLAVDLENKYSKDEILNTYLNVIYFGNNSYGIEQASQNYFGHSAKNLNLVESAILAGLIKSPALYSPLSNPENCEKRKNLVLKSMRDNNFITEEEYLTSKNEKVKTYAKEQDNFNALDELIINEAKTLLNISEKALFSSGINIYTTINPTIQKQIKESFSQKLEENQHESGIVINCETGEILGYNSTLKNPEIKRDPASLIKPILCYGAAFEHNNLVPLSPILDEKISFNGYSPQNVDNKYYGWQSARFCLSHSLNIPAIKTLEYVGVDNAIAFAENFGLEFTQNDKNLAIALGSLENGVSLKQIATAYTTFANEGLLENSFIIKKIVNNKGTVLFNHTPTKTRVCEKNTAYFINDVLTESVKNGTAKTLNNLNIPLCSKTGTNGAQDGTNLDAWNISYNNKYCVGIWCGNISGQSKCNLKKSQNGGTIATKSAFHIWKELKQNNTFNEFRPPDGIKKISFDKKEFEENHKLVIANKETPENETIVDIYPTNRIHLLKIAEPKANFLVSGNFDEFGNLIVKWTAEKNKNYKLTIISDDIAILTKNITANSYGIEFLVEKKKLGNEIVIYVENLENGAKSNKVRINTVKNADIKNSTKIVTKSWLNKN